MNFNLLKNIVLSRTVWTIITIFVINGVAGIQEYIPEAWLSLINAVLSALAIYFRTSQKRDMNEPSAPPAE